MRDQLEKLRKLVAECELIRDLATDKAKRELFDKLAKNFTVQAAEIERAIAEAKPALGRIEPEAARSLTGQPGRV